MALTFTHKEATLVGTAAIIPTGGQPAIPTTQVVDLALAEGAFVDENWWVGNIDSQQSATGLVYQSIIGEPNLVTWPAGNWTVIVYVHRRGITIIWRRIRISRINAAGTVIAEHNIVNADLSNSPSYESSPSVVGVRMGPNDSIKFSGQIAQTSLSTGLASDRIYITLEFFNAHGLKPKRFATANDVGADPPGFMKLETPLPTGAAGIEVNLTTTPNITFAALQPVASIPLVASPANAVTALKAFSPTVTTKRTALPSKARITFAALQPTVSIEATVVLTSTPSLTFAALQPDVDADRTALPTKATMNFKALEPIALRPAEAGPDAASIVFKALEPTVEIPAVEAFPNKVSTVFSALQPTVTTNQIATVPVAKLVFKALQPTVSVPALPGVARMTFQALEPTVFGGTAAFHAWDGNRFVLIGGVG